MHNASPSTQLSLDILNMMLVGRYVYAWATGSTIGVILCIVLLTEDIYVLDYV